jgi:hypothetical protein
MHGLQASLARALLPGKGRANVAAYERDGVHENVRQGLPMTSAHARQSGLHQALPDPCAAGTHPGEASAPMTKSWADSFFFGFMIGFFMTTACAGRQALFQYEKKLSILTTDRIRVRSEFPGIAPLRAMEGKVVKAERVCADDRLKSRTGRRGIKTRFS